MNTSCLNKLLYISKIIMVFCLALASGSSLQARQFRQLVPIATPEAPAANLPAGAIPVERVVQLDRDQVEPLLREVLEQWNAPGMTEMLAEEFFDSSRLMDAMGIIVPRDATLRLQSVQGIQTLQQYIMPNMDEDRDEMISIVSATARTQVEFNTPGAGFVRLPGVNEFILKVTSAAPP